MNLKLRLFIIAFLLCLCAIGCGEDHESDLVGIYGLEVLEEPSIYAERADRDRTAFRFVWMRTFDEPISLRLEIKSDGSGTLHTKMTNGQDAWLGELVVSETKCVDRATVEEFLHLVDEGEFWDLPLRNESWGKCTDGATWTIEGLQNGDYHVVQWFSPHDGPVRRIALYLLELSGLEVDEIY